MASPYLNRALTNFRAAVNARYPTRDKASDGWIGDAAHQASKSDHNPDPDGSVDAWDMDVDLGVPDIAREIERLKRVFEAHPSSLYWIHNRQIASRNSGWVRTAYTGKSPHTEHVHWNTRESHEDSNAPWNLGDTVADYSENQMRAFPWQYAGNGMGADVPAGKSTLWVLGAIYSGILSLTADVRKLLARPAATQPVVTDEQLERVLRKILGSLG